MGSMVTLPGETHYPAGIQRTGTTPTSASPAHSSRERRRFARSSGIGRRADLGTLGGPAAHANAMNSHGDIVGACDETRPASGAPSSSCPPRTGR